MSEDTKRLREFLQKLKLDTLYFEKFQEEHILFSDLEGVLEEELSAVIPNGIHRRRLFKHLNSMKEERREQVEDSPRIGRTFGKSQGESEEEGDGDCVQMLVKWDEQVTEVYDVPLEISNEELIVKLLQEFLTCRIKLQGEERMLVKKSKKFNLKRWFLKSGLSEEDTIRAVLKVEGEVLKGGRKEEELKGEVEKLKQEVEKLEGVVGERDEQLIERDLSLKMRGIELKKRDEAIEKLEKSVGERSGQLKEQDITLKQREEVIGKLRKENDRSKKENQELKKENEVLKEKMKAMESRQGRVERTGLTTTTSGIVIPKIRFVENDRTSGVFSNGNKRATGNKSGYMVFKGNYIFKVGKKYYFQARYKKSTQVIGIGVLQGDVKNTMLGYHEKGWECYCYDRDLYCKQDCTSGNYGPSRPMSASVGVLVDFTNGKREMSFFFDGKNCGVAFKDVEPPVSPTFYLGGNKGDTWEIEDIKELPK